MKPEYPERTTEPEQATDKLCHLQTPKFKFKIQIEIIKYWDITC
jgi:hypothetical protein